MEMPTKSTPMAIIGSTVAIVTTARPILIPRCILLPSGLQGLYHRRRSDWFSERRPDVHEKDRDHRQRDNQLPDHAAEVANQASPARAPGIDHSFPGNEFTHNCTNHRPNKKADDS